MTGMDERDVIRALQAAGEALRAGVQSVRQTDRPENFLGGVHGALAAFGVRADRVNLPATPRFGFRHPTYGMALLTWHVDGDAVVELVPHTQSRKRLENSQQNLRGTPYYPIIIEKQPSFRVRLSEGGQGLPLLERLSGEGYRDYVAIGLPLPNGEVQPLSVCSREPFPDDIQRRLSYLIPLLSASADAFYAGYAAFHVATTYLGRQTGPRVLEGTFTRGETDMIRAGILFCDLRGFTALSERLGADGVVPVINRVFDCIGQAVQAEDGEILKFIGDAVLSIFPAPSGSCPEALATRLVAVVRSGLARVSALSEELEYTVAVGFGGHVGDVLYGNIGTSERLDFTVMGPAVNLASRLEGLCKSYDASAIFSAEVGKFRDDLVMLGSTSVKGIGTPVQVYGLSPQDTGAT